MSGVVHGFVRLNKLLAERGVGSRRRCDAIVSEGRVRIDGRVVRELGTKVDPVAAVVEVDGRELPRPRRVVYALHKPPGVVCTSAPEETRPRAIDLVRDPGGARLFPVGRLDADSEGLLLLTNDGDLANRIAHPRYGMPKTYFVEVRGRVEPADLEKIRRGVWLAEGRTAGARVAVRKLLAERTVLLVTIREGMTREIRRAFAKVGYGVLRLKRVAIGPISVRGLHPGAYRRLEREEIEALTAPAEARTRAAEARSRAAEARTRETEART
ncbi:MAG TPA: pseudouridine synthase [Planctomycetota bacterium]|nr:pseudouridine synthase [Planctomycetota bacterium]